MDGRSLVEATIADGARKERIQGEFARSMRLRLQSESAPMLVGHLAIMALVAVLLWVEEPHPLIAIWTGAVLLATSVRAGWFWLGRLCGLGESGLLAGYRTTVLLQGLTWGIGAAIAVRGLPLQNAAVLFVVLSGMLAVAQVTLASDPPSFYRFLGGVAGPLPIGVFSQGTDPSRVVVSLAIVVFGATLILLHRRAHRDVTRHLRTATLLAARESEAAHRSEYLNALLRSAPTAMAVVDGSKRIKSVNGEFEKLFGYSVIEVTGVKLNDLLVPRSALAEARELEGRVYRGETVHVEVERRAKDGRVIPVRVSAAAVPGAAVGELLVLYEDISEQRQARRALEESEARLRRVIDSNMVGIAFGDANGVVIDANDEYLRIVGSTRDDLGARRVSFLKSALPHADTADCPLPATTIPGASQLWEKEITRSDGTSVPVVVGMAALDHLGEQGVAIMLDITERKRAEEVTREARDLAEQAAQARSMFLANMSHEIRTPMNAVLGMVELVMDTELTREQRHSLEVVRGSAESLLGILNDILDYSKIEAERLELEAIPFDLSRLVHSVTSLLALRAREKDIELIADVAADTPDVVSGDPTRVRQILTNLVGNAIKFTDEGEVVVSVRCEKLEDGRAAVRFSVRDTGIGIRASQIERIFAEFTQADASMSRQYGGTGLGLAIVKRLVNLMGGKLGVTSKPSQGSDFSFVLPLPVEASPSAPPSLAGADIKGRRVLVVDDNATNRRILREMLTREGARVEEATGSIGALGALRAAQAEGNPIPIAVVDIQMPGVDGFKLASLIRADASLDATRLLMLTSAGQRGDGAKCRALGLDGYLTKPTSRAELLEGVAAVLDGRGPGGADRQIVTRHSLAEARQSVRILLAEDVLVNQEVAATMLRKRGHYVDVVGNGREAVDAAARSRYDVILMDLQMPELDGFAATAAIRATKSGEDVPIVALTAHALAGERERCVAHGMNDHLAKPFKAHELFAVAERWGGPRARDRVEAGGGEAPVAVPAVRRSAAVPAATPAIRAVATVNLETLREQLREANSEDALDAIVDTFLESVPERVANLCEILGSGAGPDVARAAHALKSSVGAIGARPLAELLASIEASAGSETLNDRAVLASQVHAAATAVLDDLRAYRQGSKP